MVREVSKEDRLSIQAMDDLLGVPFVVLDDGFIRVVDYMGGDASIVQAARISYGTGTREIHEDRGLIRYLMRHQHTTPFEMCEVKLHIRVPMDCWRQWIRHRTANVNEYSTRYSKAIDATQRIAPEEWRLQSVENRQGSTGTISEEVGRELTAKTDELHKLSRELYLKRLNAGVAREQARQDLPLSTYTEAYWKIDLHNLLHFLDLRMDPHAQQEIRLYAELIGREIVARWCPYVWEAFVDYRLAARRFSRIELLLLGKMVAGDSSGAKRIATELGLLKYKNGRPSRNREREELEGKLVLLGLIPPWEFVDAEKECDS